MSSDRYRFLTEPVETTRCAVFESPIGPLVLSGDGEVLTGLHFGWRSPAEDLLRSLRRDESAFARARSQLTAYFAGELKEFSLALRPKGTPFQRSVWAALCDVPYGKTQSYGEVALRIGRPTASRAVGRANGQNPIAVVVPCHRVIGKGGALTGYGGGLDVKDRLLRLERGEGV